MNSNDSPRVLQDTMRLRRYVGPQEVIRIECETKCNVLVVDDENLHQYQMLRPYRYAGGFYDKFPAWIRPDFPGDWNVVIDLGGADASTRYAIMVVSDPHDPTLSESASNTTDAIQSSDSP